MCVHYVMLLRVLYVDSRDANCMFSRVLTRPRQIRLKRTRRRKRMRAVYT